MYPARLSAPSAARWKARPSGVPNEEVSRRPAQRMACRRKASSSALETSGWVWRQTKTYSPSSESRRSARRFVRRVAAPTCRS